MFSKETVACISHMIMARFTYLSFMKEISTFSFSIFFTLSIKHS